MPAWDCGAKPARTREKALSTSCESTFIGLRKYIQQLMKALSKKVTLYSVRMLSIGLRRAVRRAWPKMERKATTKESRAAARRIHQGKAMR